MTHLLETHGYFLNEAIDFHTSHFLDWLLKQRNTLVVFMGDHTNGLSTDSTALAIVPPLRLRALFKPLQMISDFMVVHEDIHRFLKSALSLGNWKQAVTNFRRSILSNRCEMFQNLERCLCKEANTTVVAYSEDFKYIVLDLSTQKDITQCAAWSILQKKVALKTYRDISTIFHLSSMSLVEQYMRLYFKLKVHSKSDS